MGPFVEERFFTDQKYYHSTNTQHQGPGSSGADAILNIPQPPIKPI
jgi:hypothetical protein